jgi:chemotaxis family two-component system sensor kinase Cph1
MTVCRRNARWVLVPDERSNASDLIEKASRALAQAKSEGKNRAIVV